MNKYFLLITLLLYGAGNLFATETFLLKNASKKFDVKITIDKCEDDICEGEANVYLLKKNQTIVLQTIKMAGMFLELGSDKKPTANMIELYGENNSGVVFEDFNFDGIEDLALRNGNNGSYGGPSYDVLLFSKETGKFSRNSALTELASENLGLFTVNKKQKTIETFNKSGCCWHQTIRYSIVNNRPVKTYIFTEDAAGANGDRVVLTTEIRVKGRWEKTTKRVPIDKYYKN